MDSREIAKKSLEVAAIQLDPVNFFRQFNINKPIFLNLQNLLIDYNDRKLIIDSFIDRLGENCEGFAAISNIGASIASNLVEHYKGNYVFLVDKKVEKNFGANYSIEYNGPRKKYYLDHVDGLIGKEFILVDDKLGTGCAIIRAVSAIRRENIYCNKFLCIFDFEYENIKKMLSGEEGFNKYNHKLTPPVKTVSLFDLETLLQVSVENNYIDEGGKRNLFLWRDRQKCNSTYIK